MRSGLEALRIAGVLLLAVSGWLGGEMVYGKPEEEKPAQQPKQAEPGSRAA